MQLSAISFLALLCFLLASVNIVVAQESSSNLKGTNRVEGRLSRQDVIENHERRRTHLAKLLQQVKDKVDDHDSGRNLMEDEDYAKHARRIPLYERKLERLNKPLDEREINRQLDRERIRSERYSRRSEL
ncbi:unnamed protein product [Cylindrotheca closterium]|uniref:Uncharacterized protein n=1 Tax=Cylindrotheca closterium TaxID=2856 RepID=A0AAD2JHD5_9STRA|nr:unnamed protein product [Cylindrotheca closterium]